MKQPKFKVWIISTIVTFVLSIILFTAGSGQFLISGGNSFFDMVAQIEAGTLSEDDFTNEFLNNLGVDQSEIDTIIGTTDGSNNNSSNSTSSSSNQSLTEDQLETQIRNQVPTIVSNVTITTKSELDTYLSSVLTFAKDNDYTSSIKTQEEFIDEVNNYIEDYILINNSTPSDLKVDEDMDEYFERTQLNNQDLEDYITKYFADNK